MKIKGDEGKRSLIVRSLLGLMFLVWLGGTAAVALAQSSTETSSGEQIVFLHLRADSEGVSLIDFVMAEGKLKIPKVPTRTYGLACQIERSSDKDFFATMVENPLVKHYEWEDPDRPGELLSKVVRLESAEFWVRIPFRSDLTRATFSWRDDVRLPRGTETVIDLGSLYEGDQK